MGGGKIIQQHSGKRKTGKERNIRKKNGEWRDSTNNRSPMFHRHSSVEKFQMKELSIKGLVLTVNKNTYQKLCGGLCRNRDTVYD